MIRAVSVLEVAHPSIWTELQVLDIDAHTEAPLDDTRRVLKPSFEREILPRLEDRVLVRYARRDATEIQAATADLAALVAGLWPSVRKVLFSAQRHALDEMVIALQAWDPENDAPAVRTLQSAGLLQALPGEGRYRLHPDLPPPPDIPYDFAEALMDETDDLCAAGPGPIGLLHDLAALAAALEHVPSRRTHAGSVSKSDARKLGRRLGAPSLAESGQLESDPRWSRALRALEALGAVSMDPIQRSLYIDLGLERTLSGETPEAVDRLVHRLLDRDLHTIVPAVRAAIRQAGEGAVDELVFLELLEEQHREVVFPRWTRDEGPVYPHLDGDQIRAFDSDGFARTERRTVFRCLRRLMSLGLIRTAEGVFAGTADGRRWAGAETGPQPPIWISSDLEIIVPPDAITPWERFQIERLGRCLGRDVVDRYRLERPSLVKWLSTHDLGEALQVLRRRSQGVPHTVEDTLTAWARSAQRIVLTRGVLL